MNDDIIDDMKEKLRLEREAADAWVNMMKDRAKLELAKKKAGLTVGMEKGREFFESAILSKLTEQKIGWWEYVKKTPLKVTATSPVIYSVFVSFLLLYFYTMLLNLFVWLIFPGAEKVKQNDYFVFDRSRILYLNWIEAFNCAYCSFGNGTVAYALASVERTGRYPREKVNRLQKLAMLPFIVFGAAVFLILNVHIQIYQYICFPAYGLPIVKQGEYFSFD